MTLKLTKQEFDSCLLDRKLNFRLSEAVRLVLVNETASYVAAGVVVLREGAFWIQSKKR